MPRRNNLWMEARKAAEPYREKLRAVFCALGFGPKEGEAERSYDILPDVDDPKTWAAVLAYATKAVEIVRLVPSLIEWRREIGRHWQASVSKARAENVETLRRLCSDAAKMYQAVKPSGKGGGRKRRRQTRQRPLTSQQMRVMQLYADHNGNMPAVATAMGLSRSTVFQHLHAAWRKLPEYAPKKANRHGRTRKVPTDRRGQVDVSEDVRRR